MARGCRDWLENKELKLAFFFNYKVDIHHIFPQKWCNSNNIDDHRRESIVNKTALSRRSNQRIGGKSPKIYVPKIETETGLSYTEFNQILVEHFIEPTALRSANFDEFFEARFQLICDLVSSAMGKEVIKNSVEFDPSHFSVDADDDEEDESVEETEE
jgi:hypothetical protein